MLGRPDDEEALRLTLAFYCIMEPDKRAIILDLAERFARASQTVDGCVHFLLLDHSAPSAEPVTQDSSNRKRPT
ncbi:MULTISPECIES: hypothetical protein [Bradyrhizobium]|jgi:quinol monooxygenase YgiN|uniref:hypothetical protein n=1 Tax=Bradyrhizobium TaxID=374 RepID=UPI0003FFA5C5|nr:MULTISPECIES: hypothetical protein [Bradyrhizobium]AUC93486.1 hypothetical protein CWS35_03485 [Bradyrhizobium sp. SK17]KIU46882.1 hypothetical protein QU41_21105 [Bradyrhizobium elkanii]MBK5653821.1 hypothetical protein [Rhizobium sp.]OCX29726.1 hypothetical protein QU42_18845 [Bradyrhizobium sp. UASWS1016]